MTAEAEKKSQAGATPTTPTADEAWMDKALEMARAGRPSPNPHVGAIVAIGEDDAGQASIAGSVSGGCIEDDLVEKVRASHGRGLALQKPEKLK